MVTQLVVSSIKTRTKTGDFITVIRLIFEEINIHVRLLNLPDTNLGNVFDKHWYRFSQKISVQKINDGDPSFLGMTSFGM
jgi:hypothetical protein